MKDQGNQSKARVLRDRWRKSPDRFFRQVLGLNTWEAQSRISEAIASGRKTRIAVKSGHKIGKSTEAAGLALWFPLVYTRGRVILTATAGHQVRNILWPEVRRIYDAAKFPLGGHLSPDPTKGWSGLPGGGGIVAVNPEKPVGMAGLSAPHMLIIVDEASGYDERLWEPLTGNMAGGAIMLALGNPTDTSGTFYDAFGLKSHLWETLTVSSADTPNAVSGEHKIPGLAGRPWLCEMLEEHTGVQVDPRAPYAELNQALEEAVDVSSFINVRILGRFPTHGDDVVIALSLVEAAARKWPDSEFVGELQIGVDPARFGDDDSTICPRRGLKIDTIRTHQRLDGPQLADKVIVLMNELRQPHEAPLVVVDVGGVGASCFDVLNQRAGPEKFDVVGVNSAESASDPNKFHNTRSQLHFAMRDWLREGGSLPPDQKLHAEAVAPKYKLDSRNRYQVEKKEEIKKRIKRSPDRFDAACLSVFSPPRVSGRLIRVKSRWS